MAIRIGKSARANATSLYGNFILQDTIRCAPQTVRKKVVRPLRRDELETSKCGRHVLKGLRDRTIRFHSAQLSSTQCRLLPRAPFGKKLRGGRGRSHRHVDVLATAARGHLEGPTRTIGPRWLSCLLPQLIEIIRHAHGSRLDVATIHGRTQFAAPRLCRLFHAC